MKKINVIVRESTILELTEDASKGDIIDLKEVVKVDTSYINTMIEEGKDKVYQSKLIEAKKIYELEKSKEISKLQNDIDSLIEKAKRDLKDKESEINQKNNETINKLQNEINLLKQSKEKDLALKEKEVISKYEKELIELENKIKEQENKTIIDLKAKELELTQKYSETINKLQNEIALDKVKNESSLENIKSNYQLELEKALNNQKAEYDKKLKELEDKYLALQNKKSNMNIKQTGEDLEAWCNNEVISYMQNGLFNCIWFKDNKVVKNEGEEKGSKADYIFKIYANSNHNENELLDSVCLEMKDENPESKIKQTNEHYYKKLDENRNKKGCKYALLVSNLELDKPNILPIYKVREYENMYVVRPGYLMVFLNMITSLSTRFSDLLLSKKQEDITLNNKLEIINEFNSIKQTYLDAPLETLNKQIESILKSSESIKKASNDIDNTCEKITSNYIKKIIDKIDKFEIKLNKNIIKNMDE